MADEHRKADPSKANKAVQMSVQGGLAGCRVFHKRTPLYVRLFIIDIGNEAMNLP
jgi:hypothetical protein